MRAESIACIFSLFLVVGQVAAQGVSQQESDALMALFTATSGPGWPENSGWGNIGNECSWYGVTCSGSHVIELRLSGNGLNGALPVEIGYLTYLQTLSITDNVNLTGSIPATVGNLSNLRYLFLYANSLSGPIPPQIGNLRGLLHLKLARNQLNGPIPPIIGSLTNLLNLDLRSNELGGPIPPQLGNLRNLNRLDLTGNNLSGPIPPQLGNLFNLASLIIEFNELEGSIPGEICNLANLEELYLGGNQLSGTIPPQIMNLTGLTGLSLGGNQLSGTIPPQIGSLSNLSWLDLGANRLEGPLPSQLVNLTSICDGSYWCYYEKGLYLGYNLLYTDSPVLAAFVDSRYSYGNLMDTQTVTPKDLSVVSVSDRTVWLEWTPIDYIENGGYEVFNQPAATGVQATSGTTPSKAVSTFPATGLQPGKGYYFRVQTFSEPYAASQGGMLVSEPTPPVYATTGNTGCTAPTVQVSGCSLPVVLTVTSSYDSCAWSTGETTPSIAVGPVEPTYYWVRTIDGPCDEAAIVLVTTCIIFTDGFESWDTSHWSKVAN